MGWWETKPEYRGRWWIPDQPDNQVQGILKLKKFEAATLDLDEPLTITMGDDGSCSALLGEAADGTKLTLSRNYPGLYARPQAGIPIRAKSFLVETVFVNGQWQNGQEIGFHELRMQFKNLGYWSRYDPFDLDFDGSTREATLRVKPPEKRTIYRDDHFHIYLLNWAPESASHGVSDSHITFQRETLICIKADQEKSYEMYISYIETIQSFLCFCLGSATFPEKIQGFSSVHTLPIRDTSPSSALPIDICTVAFRRHQAVQLSDERLVRAPLSLEDLEDQTQAVIERWRTIQETFTVPWMLFLSTLFNRQMYREQKFLTRSQCIEIYHRTSKQYSETLRDPATYDKRLETVKTALKEHTSLPSNVRRFFISRLKNGNKPAFKDRIDGVLDKTVPSSYQVKFSSPDFAQKIVDNRNHLTHWDPKDGFVPASPDELTEYTQQLGRLFYLCLLDELALDPNIIEKVFGELQSWNLPH